LYHPVSSMNSRPYWSPWCCGVAIAGSREVEEGCLTLRYVRYWIASYLTGLKQIKRRVCSGTMELMHPLTLAYTPLGQVSLTRGLKPDCLGLKRRGCTPFYRTSPYCHCPLSLGTSLGDGTGPYVGDVVNLPRSFPPALLFPHILLSVSWFATTFKRFSVRFICGRHLVLGTVCTALAHDWYVLVTMLIGEEVCDALYSCKLSNGKTKPPY
jgi:hypothetical protein